MTAESMIAEIVQCFVPPPRPMIEKMKSLAEGIAEDARQSVIDRITEQESPSAKIGVKQMVEACDALGVGYRRARFVPAEDWTCDSCGRSFKFALAPSDDDMLDRGLFSFCPDCGFQPGWTKLMEQYRALGIATEWYDRLMADHEDFGPGKPQTKVWKGGMVLTRGGPFWNRAQAEEDRRKEKRISVEAKMHEIDRAKKWARDKARGVEAQELVAR